MEHSEQQNATGGFFIFADDSTALGTGKTGLSITTELSKAGGAAATVSPTITERADVADGVYWVAPIAAHRNTLGRAAWGFSATGAVIAPRFEKIVAVDDQTAAFGANTTTPPTTAAINTAVEAGQVGIDAAAILVDTAQIGVAGAGLTNLGGSSNDWNTTTPPTAAAVAIAVEAAILNEGDATALLAAIAAKVEEFLINEGDATATIAAIATACNAAIVAGQVGIDAAAILVDTAQIGVAGAGLTNLGGSANNWNTTTPPTTAAINTAVEAGTVGTRLDTLTTNLGSPVGASISADVAAVQTDVTTLTGRITAALFSGITSLASWLGILAGKTADAGTLAEVNLTTGGTAFNNTTDSLEAIKDSGGGSVTVAGYAAGQKPVLIDTECRYTASDDGEFHDVTISEV